MNQRRANGAHAAPPPPPPPPTGGVIVTNHAELAAIVGTAVAEAIASAQPANVPRLLDRVELARALSCSPSQVDKLRRRGMPHIRVGESPRFEPDECMQWLRSQKEETE